MPYCERAPDGSYEYIFTKEDVARMGIPALEKLNRLLRDKELPPEDGE
jgi:hypothetical protein